MKRFIIYIFAIILIATNTMAVRTSLVSWGGSDKLPPGISANHPVIVIFGADINNKNLLMGSSTVITLRTDGGFKAGDILTISAVNPHSKPECDILLTPSNEDMPSKVVWPTSESDPFKYTRCNYTLEEDMESLILTANSGSYINYIKVTRDIPASTSLSISNDNSKNGKSLNLIKTAPEGVTAVDLGLPSGTKWANCNIGANNSEDLGLVFAWGDTVGYENHRDGSYALGGSWENYKWYSENCMTKYNMSRSNNLWDDGLYDSKGNFIGDANSELDGVDDAATANWGENWRMPTCEEWVELMDNCEIVGSEITGTGWLMNASNGNSIFLPSYDICSERYWTSSLCRFDPSGAWGGMPGPAEDPVKRYCRRSVRAVYQEVPKVITTLTVNANGCSNSNTLQCYAGTIVELIAENDVDGQQFVRWSDGETANPRLIEVKGNMTFTAEYTIPFSVSNDTGKNGQKIEVNAKDNGVDLALPSGLKWATTNVGAETPYDRGYYFSWGETIGYTDDVNDGRSFDWKNYKWCNGTVSSLTKYCTNEYYGDEVDNKTMLESLDDAATVAWGRWRTPTAADWEELKENCTWTKCLENGVNGYRISGLNGNSIFLPATGFRKNTTLNDDDICCYWSSSLSNISTYDASFLYGKDYVEVGYRYYAMPVRPVLNNVAALTVDANGYSNPNVLNCPVGTKVTLTAVSDMAGSEFVKWSDGVTNNPRIISVNQNITLTAIYSSITIHAKEDPDNAGDYYTTYYDSENEYSVKEGTKAYTGIVDGDKLKMTAEADNIIPAGEGVLLKGNTANVILTLSDTEKEQTAGNALTGSDTNTTALANSYIFTYAQNGLGFYQYAAGKPLAAHKAYLVNANNAKGFRMVFDGMDGGTITGIEGIGSECNSGITIYSVSGIRLNKLQKGINIIGGKKIAVK